MPNPIGKPTESGKDNSDNLPNRPETRSTTRTKLEISKNNTTSINKAEYLIDFENQNMAEGKLSLETLIKLIPKFEGKKGGDNIYQFFNSCDFAMKNVDPSLRDVLVQAIQTKLGGKAFDVTQNRIITDWEGLKTLLESTFCAQRTPGYLQLELNSTRQKSGEPVQDYATRVENLLRELCNVSVSGKSTEAATAIRNYIKEVTLTTYVEGLEQNLKQTIKARQHTTLEDAINDSLEEEKLLKSNLDSQRLLKDKQGRNTVPRYYCSICRRTNHNTAQCRFANSNASPRDTGQKNYTQSIAPSTSIRTISCSYCKHRGHSIEECFKKRRADNRQSDKAQHPTPGNDSRPNAQGPRSVKDIKTMGPIKNLCIE